MQWLQSYGSLANLMIPDIDLTKLVPELDSTATDIVIQQRDSLISRKDLAQKTKDFRKLDDGAKLGEFKGLLKGRSFRGGLWTCSVLIF